MKSIRLSILSLALSMIAAASLQAAELATAKVVSVTGSVTNYAAGGGQAPLKVGDILREGDSVSVSALSEAALVFSNGSEITVKENTSVTLATLQQAPFSGGQSYGQLQADPSRSQTVLELNYGDLTSHVKQLRSDSQFDVETPLGTASIQGTRFSASLFYNAERGDFLFTITNHSGQVDVFSRYAGTLHFGDGNIGDKVFDANIEEMTREPIPADHTVVIRINRHDPHFNALYDMTKNHPSKEPSPFVMPGPPPGAGGGSMDDFGIIVVSPEGPGGN